MVEIRFDNQVVIVTGAGGGLGRSYALEIARRGGSVVVNDLGTDVHGHNPTHAAVDAVVDEIRSFGGKAVPNYDSVADKAGGEAICQAAISSFGRIDAVINNAGNLRNAWFGEIPDDDFDALFNVHVRGAFNVSQPAFRVMKDQGYGRFLFTSSASGVFGHETQSVYATAKTALLGLMNVVALEGKPHGILANALCPSALGRMGEKMLPGTMDEMAPAVGKFLPSMDPAFVAPLVVFLVSRNCAATHSVFTAVGNHFARAFIGFTEGWLNVQGAQTSVEDIERHFAQISDIGDFSVPGSITDQLKIIAAHIEAK